MYHAISCDKHYVTLVVLLAWGTAIELGVGIPIRHGICSEVKPGLSTRQQWLIFHFGPGIRVVAA
jgi:hypothetical protein